MWRGRRDVLFFGMEKYHTGSEVRQGYTYTRGKMLRRAKRDRTDREAFLLSLPSHIHMLISSNSLFVFGLIVQVLNLPT